MVGNMDGSVVVELLKLETTPHHLTMDPISGNLYWIGSVGAHTDIYTCSRSGAGIIHPDLISFVSDFLMPIFIMFQLANVTNQS